MDCARTHFFRPLPRLDWFERFRDLPNGHQPDAGAVLAAGLAILAGQP